MIGWGAWGQAPWCLQGDYTHSWGQRQLLPLQAALQRPPVFWEQSRRTKARAWRLKGSTVPSSGQEGPEQSYRSGLHGACQSLPWRAACHGVQGKCCWSGMTWGPAGPGAQGCWGTGAGQGSPRGQQVSRKGYPGERSWAGLPRGPADPRAVGCQGSGAGLGSPVSPGLRAGGHRGRGVTGVGGGRRSEVGPGEGALRSLLKELPCVGGGFSPEPELSQSRRLAWARLPAASRRPGPPPAARLGRQRRDGAFLSASSPGPAGGW